MSIKNRLSKLKDKKDPAEGIFKLMKYFGWSLKEIRELTVPQYLVLVHFANKIEKDLEVKRKNGRK